MCNVYCRSCFWPGLHGKWQFSKMPHRTLSQAVVTVFLLWFSLFLYQYSNTSRPKSQCKMASWLHVERSHFWQLVESSRENPCCTQQLYTTSRGALVPYWFRTALNCQTLSNHCSSVEVNYEVGQKFNILPHSWDKYSSIEHHPPCPGQAMKQIQATVEQDPQDSMFLPKSKSLGKFSDLRYSDIFLLYMVKMLFFFKY